MMRKMLSSGDVSAEVTYIGIDEMLVKVAQDTHRLKPFAVKLSDGEVSRDEEFNRSYALNGERSLCLQEGIGRLKDAGLVTS